MDINKIYYQPEEIASDAYTLQTARVIAAAALNRAELRAAAGHELGMLHSFAMAGGLSTRGAFDQRIDAAAEAMQIDIKGHSGSSWAIAVWTAWQLVVNGELEVHTYTPPGGGEEEAE